MHGEDPTGYVPKIQIYTSLNAPAHLQTRVGFAVMKQRAVSGWLYKIWPGFAHFFPSSDPSGNPQRTYNTQDFSCIKEKIQTTISSVLGSLQLKAAMCTASSTNLLGTSSPAHAFYTSKSEVKLFQLGPQHHSGRTNLLMKEFIKPITLPQKPPHCSCTLYILIGLCRRGLICVCMAIHWCEEIIRS